MPRETISSTHPHIEGDLPFQIEVGWQRDQDVQVGISTYDHGDGQRHLVDYVYGSDATLTTIGHHLLSLLVDGTIKVHADVRAGDTLVFETPSDEVAAEWGRAVLDAVTGSAPFGTSVWARPDRVQINRLIVLLRKARDAAFGRDE